MSPAKKPAAKKKDESEEIVAPLAPKKGFDIDGHEIVDTLHAIPDKIVEETEELAEAADTDENSDEAELDEEEIDPFKDKWEQ